MGLIGGTRSYDGPGLAQWAPWKCPACAAENSGPISAGCVSCGSGSAQGRHVGVQPPADGVVFGGREPFTVRPTPRERDSFAAAKTWADAHPLATIAQAFLAGVQHAHEQMMTAPPVTADVVQLAPEGKPRRTIIAALELFKDQVLREAQEEIASGEWCSVEETEKLIAQFKHEEGVECNESVHL